MHVDWIWWFPAHRSLTIDFLAIDPLTIENGRFSGGRRQGFADAAAKLVSGGTDLARACPDVALKVRRVGKAGGNVKNTGSEFAMPI